MATGIALSVVAAWYSVTGLVAIFAGASLAIIILGGTLEFGKIILASWLYRNWKQVPLLLKSYFTIALLVLMLITSMGIFGFLSKAHLEQTAPAGDVAAKIERIDGSLARERMRITRGEQQLAQMDKAIDAIIDRNNRAQTAMQVRTQQKKERDALNKTIDDTNKRIADINAQKLKLQQAQAKTEAEAVVAKVSISIAAYEARMQPSFTEEQHTKSGVTYKPHGVMAVLGPFNFPAHLSNGHIVPALLAAGHLGRLPAASAA